MGPTRRARTIWWRPELGGGAAVYAAGYSHTRLAADRLTAQFANRRPVSPGVARRSSANADAHESNAAEPAGVPASRPQPAEAAGPLPRAEFSPVTAAEKPASTADVSSLAVPVASAASPSAAPVSQPAPIVAEAKSEVAVGIVNIEQNENMELARPSSIPPSGAQRPSRGRRQRVGSLQIASHTPVGEPRPPAPTRRPATLGEAGSSVAPAVLRRVPAGAGRPAAERGRPGISDNRKLNYDQEREPVIINTATVRTPGPLSILIARAVCRNGISVTSLPQNSNRGRKGRFVNHTAAPAELVLRIGISRNDN